jgi:eukaryotic-like serine/threonine-protein kinase
MSLPAGSNIGGYIVLGPLGAGAMGEVYRARDEKLGREIALKILPDSVAADSERRARFAREARVLASLNHLHIGGIYGFEDATASTPPALVLELVPGPTVEERLAGGPLPVDVALSLARQIADGLDAAHERGIVHRDLKPANIKVTPDGTAKVLDFGIAKVLEAEDSKSASTRTASATHIGTTIGSAAYMSPEQARGEAVDRRTDVWAFGCVLFEMLSGVRAFPGATASEALVAVLSRDPDWSALPAATPPAVQRLLRRCLQKDIRRRLRDIGDARAHLEDLGAGEPTASARRTWRWAYLLLGAVGGAMAAALIWTLSTAPNRTGGTPASVIRTHLLTPDGLALAARDGSYPLALSPDGSAVAFVVEREGQSELYARRLSEPLPVLLAASAGSIKPFFSPDGRWIAYAAGDALQKVDVGGGTAIRICNIQGTFTSGTWGPDGSIVWAIRAGGLFSVPAGGGAVKAIPGSEGAAWPHIAPDGKTLLVTTDRSTALARMPLSGGAPTIIARLNREGDSPGVPLLGAGGGLAQAQLVSGGYIVYGQSPGVVMALPVNPETLQPSGSPVPIVDLVERGRNSGSVYFGVSRTGLLVYAPTGRQHRLVWVNRQGVETPLSAERGDFRTPVLSADDSRVVVGMNDETRRAHVWLYETARGTRTWLGMRGLVFAWAPGGEAITAGDGNLVAIPITPGAPRTTLVPAESLRPLLPAGTNPYPTSWSTDGRYLLFHADERQIWLLDTATKEVRALIADAASNATQAVFSPDGRRIAYSSNASGRYEIWTRSFPELADATQVSLNGGTNPKWAATGREIFYRAGDSMMSAPIETARQVRVGQPVRLFSGHYEGAGHDLSFSVTRDGQRFVMVKGDPASRLDRLVVVQHFFDNLAPVAQR